ncbi:peptidoglycan recognition protein-like isoform X2 [Linepithema humile]|uniref:peptidoglycan recognition protein-like isoform X2 n=1 Tax=Linepithema humile TaxID=83485 RepID=UPI00351DFE12
MHSHITCDSNKSTHDKSDAAEKCEKMQMPISRKGDIKNKWMSVQLVGREEWNATNSTDFLPKLKLPVPYVIIMQINARVDSCSTRSKCVDFVRAVQKAYIKYKYTDIAYNFLAGGDGRIYVGRDWDYMGSHSFGYDNRSINIVFIGPFHNIKPPEKQLDAAQKLIELGVEIGKIAPDYKLLGLRQIVNNLNPGKALYNIIKTWPHWSPNP